MFHGQIEEAYKRINEARHELDLAKAGTEAEIERVVTRLLHECLAKRMSPEHIAKMAGWPVQEVRTAMRARGIEPKRGKTVLAKQSASALIDNAHLLGIEPEEMDLTSPLAYLPMGKELREFLETNPVKPAPAVRPEQSVVSEGLWCESCETFEYEEPVSFGCCLLCGCAGSAHIASQVIVTGAVE